MPENDINLYPGSDRVAERRRFILNPKSAFRKMRGLSDDDLVLLLGHRAPGSKYESVHPSLDELNFPEDPIKYLVEPTAGARAGDKFRYLQMTDSVYFSPLTPWFRARLYHSRYRGIDTLMYAGRELLEARERDLEKCAKEQLETELFDPARTSVRGITVHGHSLRLDENGMMFDARQRCMYDEKSGEVIYTKDQQVKLMDRPVSVGKPMDEGELKDRAIVYRPDTVSYRGAEIWDVMDNLFDHIIIGSFDPDLNVEDFKEKMRREDEKGR